MSYNRLGSFEIKTKFPTLTDIISASKKHFAVYSKMKKKYTNMVWAFAKAAHVKTASGPIRLTVIWREPKKSRRDPDNVMAAKKFILDGLVNAGVIQNDSHKYVSGCSDIMNYNWDCHEVKVYVDQEVDDGW